MKKLDNKGWGLSTMIAFLCVFAVFIIVIAILSWRLDTQREEQDAVDSNLVPDTSENLLD